MHQNRNNLHLKLSGEFDGSSAHQLINTLKNHYGNARNIYIHTSSLSCVPPFGQDVSNIIGEDRDFESSSLKQALKSLGWDEHILDYRALELICLYLEGRREIEPYSPNRS